MRKIFVTNIIKVTLLICLVVSAYPMSFIVSGGVAFAEEGSADISQIDSEIERYSNEYNSALEKSDTLNTEIVDTENRISEIEKKLPESQDKANSAVRSMFFFNDNVSVLLNMIFGIQSLTEAMNNFNYIDYIYSKNKADIASFTGLKNELVEKKNGLDQKKQEAQSAADSASSALSQAQAAKEKAQREAEERAVAEAAQAAAALEAAQNQQLESEKNGQAPSNLPVNPNPPKSDNADWSQDKTTFVNSWAPRIDAYMAGFPLAGYGSVFAEAAYDYGVDPRFSPAISCVESTKGMYCFLPHNAWGWGSVSWDSWDEAIRSHVRGLSRGYGYTLSVAAAKKYCPPTWERWYEAVSAQMNLI